MDRVTAILHFERMIVSMRVMVTLGFSILPEQLSHVQSLIPAEQTHIAALRERGTVEVFYLSADRAHAWLVMMGDTPESVAAELARFPLFPYMRPTFTPLQ